MFVRKSGIIFFVEIFYDIFYIYVLTRERTSIRI